MDIMQRHYKFDLLERGTLARIKTIEFDDIVNPDMTESKKWAYKTLKFYLQIEHKKLWKQVKEKELSIHMTVFEEVESVPANQMVM